mmetsp:Transcript_3743/g.9026  ORF Transcript_3743/g.9026 Transcript_3743/m.9026 type:complete len:210 (-) Transcript_3743:1013-1642(-)
MASCSKLRNTGKLRVAGLPQLARRSVTSSAVGFMFRRCMASPSISAGIVACCWKKSSINSSCAAEGTGSARGEALTVSSGVSSNKADCSSSSTGECISSLMGEALAASSGVSSTTGLWPSSSTGDCISSLIAASSGVSSSKTAGWPSSPKSSRKAPDIKDRMRTMDATRPMASSLCFRPTSSKDGPSTVDVNSMDMRRVMTAFMCALMS